MQYIFSKVGSLVGGYCMSDDEFDVAIRHMRRATGAAGAGVRRLLARPAAAAAVPAAHRHRDVSTGGGSRSRPIKR